MYTEWATAQVSKIRDILNSARADHTRAVQERIESVSQLGSVVDVTKDLFAVSKVRSSLNRPPVIPWLLWEARKLIISSRCR